MQALPWTSSLLVTIRKACPHPDPRPSRDAQLAEQHVAAAFSNTEMRTNFLGELHDVVNTLIYEFEI